MEINIMDEAIRQLKEILIKGGELRIIVERRGNERIPTIYSYPDNKTICNKETLTE